MRLIDFFDRGVGINPSRTCLKDATVSRTFREVQLRSYRIANALASAGLKTGEMAAVYSLNGRRLSVHPGHHPRRQYLGADQPAIPPKTTPTSRKLRRAGAVP